MELRWPAAQCFLASNQLWTAVVLELSCEQFTRLQSNNGNSKDQDFPFLSSSAMHLMHIRILWMWILWEQIFRYYQVDNIKEVIFSKVIFFWGLKPFISCENNTTWNEDRNGKKLLLSIQDPVSQNVFPNVAISLRKPHDFVSFLLFWQCIRICEMCLLSMKH